MLKAQIPLPSQLLQDAPADDVVVEERLAADETGSGLTALPADEASSVELSTTDLLEDEGDEQDVLADGQRAVDDQLAFADTVAAESVDMRSAEAAPGQELDESDLLATRQLPALVSPMLAADATGEIEAMDILEVANALRTPRLPALTTDEVAAVYAPEPVAAAVAPENLSTYRMASSASMADVGSPSSTEPLPRGAMRSQPSSIAPLALDVAPAMRPSLPSATSWLSTASTTQQIARIAGIPTLSPRVVMAAASVFGMCVFAAVAGAALGFSRPSHESSVVTGSGGSGVHEAPRVPVVESVHEEISQPGDEPKAKAKDSTSGIAHDDPSDDTSASTSTSHAPSATVRSSSAPKVSSSSAASSARSSGGSGTIKVSGASGVLVDGAPHKVSGGGVVVACGRHMVKAPGHAARLVVVPCGGQTTL